MTPPTQERLMTPDEVEAGVAARLAAYTRGQRRGPLTGDVHLWAYGATLAGWRASELRLAEAEQENHALRVMWNEQTGDNDLEIDAMLKDYVDALASNESPPQGFGWRDGKLYADDGSVMYPKETPREHAARDHGQHEIPMIAHWCGRPVTGLSKAELVAALNMMAAEVEAMRSRHKGELDFALNLGTQERARR